MENDPWDKNSDAWAEFFKRPEPKTYMPHRRNKKPELKVQAAIVQYLLTRGVVLAITDAGALMRVGLGFNTGIPGGWPDLTCCLPCGGQFMGVECKAPGGRQSPKQKKAQLRIEGNGGLYILASSLEEFVEKFGKVH